MSNYRKASVLACFVVSFHLASPWSRLAGVLPRAMLGTVPESCDGKGVAMMTGRSSRRLSPHVCLATTTARTATGRRRLTISRARTRRNYLFLGPVLSAYQGF